MRGQATILWTMTLAAAGAAQPSAQAADVKAQAQAALGLLDCAVLSVDVDPTPGAALRVAIPIDGVEHTLFLAPHSIRAAGYQVLAQRADGALVPEPPGPIRTLRGVVGGIPGSAVAGSVGENGLTASLFLPGGGRLHIEPARDYVDAPAGAHIVYRGEDVIPPAGVCGVTDEFVAARPAPAGGHAAGATRGAGGVCVTELACDADFEFFQALGSVNAVENRINSIINTMNMQYEQQVAITHDITTIVVRTAEPDPYTSTDPGTLLQQFRNHWNTQVQGVPRDVAELFTGKNLDGSVIGIAWLNAICTSNRYNVVQNLQSQACRTDLSAHELGHNWGASHCSCPSRTMNPSLTCSNRFNSNLTVPAIIAFRDSRECIECIPPVEPPQLSVAQVAGVGPDVAMADVRIVSDPVDWWTVGGVTNQADGLAPLAAGIALAFQADPNSGEALFTAVGGGGDPGNPVTFVSLPRDQFSSKRFSADGAATIAGAYEPTGPDAALDAGAVNVGFLQFPPSADGSDVPDDGYFIRVTLDLSGGVFSGQPVAVSDSGPPAGFPFALGEFKVAAATRDHVAPLTELTFGFYTTEPPDCPGDLDGNGAVDLSDLSVALANFGTTSGAGPEDGDLDGDGDVDLTDLAILLSVFGTLCP